MVPELSSFIWYLRVQKREAHHSAPNTARSHAQVCESDGADQLSKLRQDTFTI
jgi:hypothetical protein